MTMRFNLYVHADITDIYANVLQVLREWKINSTAGTQDWEFALPDERIVTVPVYYFECTSSYYRYINFIKAHSFERIDREINAGYLMDTNIPCYFIEPDEDGKITFKAPAKRDGS